MCHHRHVGRELAAPVAHLVVTVVLCILTVREISVIETGIDMKAAVEIEIPGIEGKETLIETGIEIKIPGKERRETGIGIGIEIPGWREPPTEIVTEGNGNAQDLHGIQEG